MPSETTPAVVCHGTRASRVVERPSSRAGEVLVEVGAAAISGKDVKRVDSGPLSWGRDDRRGCREAPFVARELVP